MTTEPDKYASSIAANVALEALVKALVASKAIDEHKFHQALADAMRRLNSSGDVSHHEAAKALKGLYYR
jgi:hypothetical protein